MAIDAVAIQRQRSPERGALSDAAKSKGRALV
jgi:hypothetical protein